MTEKKARIGFFVYSLCFGGAERVLIEILRNLPREEFEMHVTARRLEGEYLADIPTDVSASEFPKGMKLFRVFHFRKAIRDEVHKHSLDIVCCFGPELSVMTALSGLAETTKWCITEHTIPSKCFGKSFSGKIRTFLMKRFYKKANYVIGVSHATTDDLREHFDVPEEILRVINNPIDLKNIPPRNIRASHPSEEIIIVSCGRLIPPKNFDRLLKAYATIVSPIASRLIIIGDGPERNRLVRLSTTLGIADKVLFTGYQKDPHRFFTDASFFVLNSSFEGFGNVLAEAMAYGLPVISSRSGGAEDIVTDKVNGILVPVHDDIALAAAIRRLLENDDERENMAVQARNRSLDFSTEKIIGQYSGLFREMIAR